jgi:ribonuclease HI
MVHELLDPQTGEWMEELLQAKFASVDVHAIMQIPIGGLEDDFWAWHLEKHGNFSVRSAYRALLQANEVNGPVVGSYGSEQSFWKKLWKMKVPPKVRNYWWRVIKGFIPCRSVLKKRHIERISFCQACGGDETIKHALFHCTWAKLFWQEIRVVTGVKIPDFHPDSWAVDLIDSSRIRPRDAAVILCGAWAVWSERNARNHGEKSRTVSESVKWTADIALDLAIIGRSNSKQTPKIQPRWKPPEEGILKLNVDASFSNSLGEGATGLVLRNHAGVLVRGQAIWYEHAANALVMEALAFRDGVKLACDLGLPRIEVETDASEVVKLWNSRNQGRSEIASIFREVEGLISNLELFTLSCIRWEANEGAHLCAKQASASRRRCLWINYIPSFLVQCLLNDCKPDD